MDRLGSRRQVADHIPVRSVLKWQRMATRSRVQDYGASAFGLVPYEMAVFLIRDLAPCGLSVGARDSQCYRRTWIRILLAGREASRSGTVREHLGSSSHLVLKFLAVPRLAICVLDHPFRIPSKLRIKILVIVRKFRT